MTTDDAPTSEEPTVSVVTPTYNHADKLPRAIESVLDQTFDGFEHLIVDDASTDDTADVVQSYDDPRIRYVRHEENCGGSAARNTGIDHARGEYIAFLDADDEWLPGKLEAQVEVLRTKAEDWVAVYCETVNRRHGPDSTLRREITRVLSAVGGQPREPDSRSGGEELVRELLTKRLSVGGGSTLLVEATAVDALGGFDESFDRHQDLEFLIRLLKIGKLAYVEEPLVFVHESGAPSPDPHRFTKMRFFSTFADDVKALEADGEHVLGAHWYDLSKFYFREGRLRKGTQFMIGAHVDGTIQLFALLHAIATGVYRRVASIVG